MAKRIAGNKKAKSGNGENGGRRFKRQEKAIAEPGFCRVATLDKVRSRQYALTPGRYVGSDNQDDTDAPLEERLPKLIADVEHHLTRRG